MLGPGVHGSPSCAGAMGTAWPSTSLAGEEVALWGSEFDALGSSPAFAMRVSPALPARLPSP